MEQWKQDAPVVDLAEFPIAAKHEGGDPDDGEHTIRNKTICKAVAAALKLPRGVALSGHERYASLGYASGGGPAATDYRIRVNGFAPGEGSKAKFEYLSISIVGLCGFDIVAWTEDIQRLGGTPKSWADFNAGKFPGRSNPPPLKGSPKLCGRLTFVGTDQHAIDITKQMRALVAKVAPEAPAAQHATKKRAKR